MLDETTRKSGADAKRLGRSEPAPRAVRTPEAEAEAQRRKDDYRLFRRNAAIVFDAPADDAGHLRMRERCGYHVSMTRENERAPAAADAVVEVFYGPRTLPELREVQGEAAQRHWRAPVETGAALLYTQGAEGAVTTFLYPAQTDRFLADEDAIVLGRYTDLAPLTGRGTLEAHWAALRAYAEVTSLDGEPTFADRLGVAWLRLSRPRVIDSRRVPAQGLAIGLQIVAFGAALAIAAVLLGVR